MLTHIVIWKYLPETTDAERAEHVARLRRLPALIPQIESFAVGFDALRLPRSYDLGLVAIFRDRAGLDVYTDHPEHVLAAVYGRNITEHIGSVDFENVS